MMVSQHSRRRILQTAAATGTLSLWPNILRAAEAAAAQGPVAKRAIPKTGEMLPVIGLGTFIVFNFKDDPAKMEACRKVVQNLMAGGASLIDTAPRYEEAEERVGDIVASLNARDKLFLATKVWTDDERPAQTASMAASLKKLRTGKVDLMQFHVVDKADTSLAILRDFKAAGHTRYIGFSNSRNYAALEAVMKREKPDFFQVDYSIDNRDCETHLLPTAKDEGIAVLVNLPFGRSALFARTKGQPLPAFAAELGIQSWAQYFLKFVISHPAVNVAIPGTNDPAHMLDNLGAGRGPMPDAATRQRMIAYWDSLPGAVPYQDKTRGR
jgi:diketogulonate reductase-like aldo/keto reductase